MIKTDMEPARHTEADFARLAADIKRWGLELGFQQVGIADTDLSEAEVRLLDWLAQVRHGEMAYMATHGLRRSRPAELVPGTLRVISARLDYLPQAAAAEGVLARPELGYVSRYALGRDYHKLIRNRLQRLAERIEADVGLHILQPQQAVECGVLEGVHPRLAPPLEGLERRRQGLLLGKRSGQRHRVFHRQLGARPDGEVNAVQGIAQQHDVLAVPVDVADQQETAP